MLKKSYQNKFFIILQSFLFRYLIKDIKIIYISLVRVINLNKFKNTNFFLPKKIKKFSVVRSPTMSKLSKEQFEFRFYKAFLLFNINNFLDITILNFFFLSLDLSYSYLKLKTLLKF